SHLAGTWSLGSSGPEHRAGAVDVELERGRRYLVNVGRGAPPRERHRRAAYAIWDVERGTIAVRRVAYDIAGAREKILRGGLPRFLADRLLGGPSARGRPPPAAPPP